MLNRDKELWSVSEIKCAYVQDFAQTIELVNQTKGAKLWKEYSDFLTYVELLESCLNDVLEHIKIFGEETKIDDFWYPTYDAKRKVRELEIRKAIFSASSAVMGVVGNFRKLSTQFPVPDTNKKRLEIIGEDGLHEFLQELRNEISHVKLAEASWVLKRDFVNKTRNVHFYFHQEDIQGFSDWNLAAREYFKKNNAKVDVYNTYSDYLGRVQAYYAWFKEAFASEYEPMISSHHTNVSSLQGVENYFRWNMIEAKTHSRDALFELLPKYLSISELAELDKSKDDCSQQAEIILNSINTNNSFTPELIEKIKMKVESSC
ncbi:hypothetical protein ACMAZD_22370 [Vibrio sp. nBUS_14]|uniref:hypothetical protein n=1 Tax=Vibrio sp. nBUS_14 TaxID=3395321 RepID=UPI003EBE0658